jgi:ATP-dependent DNA helicase RecQ
MSQATQVDLESLLPRFGLSGFRTGQMEVISAVLAGEDCLCVMPTGGGKSLCYQLPAVARPGLTLVVSPLIALMKDQVDQLTALGIRATLINSTLTSSEQYARLEAMAAGAYELVYVVPERFRSPRFLEAVSAIGVNLLAVDEAHCISEWGHDFRPDYAKLGRFRQRLGNPTTIALTATATAAVRADIVQQLGLNAPRTFITGFIRPNLHYYVQSPGSARRKDQSLIEFLAENPGSGIVYASTRKRCEEVAQQIADQTRRTTGVYHAGMTNEDRHKAQDDFMQGRSEIVVATTAFGMGIDKANVRFVVHYNLPGTLEGYYQEAGRAGRDGQAARCLLLYSAGDRRIQEFFIESAYPARETVARVYEFLRCLEQDPIELTLQEIKDALSLPISADGVGTCEQLLEKAGVLERLEPRENMAIVRLDSELPTLVDLLPRQAKVQRRVLQAIERVVGRRRSELVYFNPRELLAETELDAPALSRTLRELRHLKAFDYIPPFRGRAIHLIQRDKTFPELDLDFESLDRRKANEYDKLRRVIAFAQTNRCRQQEILEYFGQTDAPDCGRCDNCTRHARPRAQVNDAPSDERVDYAARIALSGVARTRSRFGKHLVAQMLCGSNSAKITRFGMQRLSTYGLLRALKQDEVVELMNALITANYLEQVELENNRPTLQLTDSGRELMAGRIACGRLALPPALVARLPAAVPVPVAAVGVPEAPPPESIEVADFEPDESPPEFESVVMRTTALPASEPAKKIAPAPAAPKPTESQPSHYWTWRLLSEGYSVDDCAVVRNLDREVVLDHALRAIDSGWKVEAAWFLSLEQRDALEKIIGPGEPARVRPLLAQLPKGLRYEDVQLFLKCRKSGQSGSADTALPSAHRK